MSPDEEFKRNAHLIDVQVCTLAGQPVARKATAIVFNCEQFYWAGGTTGSSRVTVISCVAVPNTKARGLMALTVHPWISSPTQTRNCVLCERSCRMATARSDWSVAVPASTDLTIGTL